MRIEDLHQEESGGLTRVGATVRWETAARPPEEVYFELPTRLAATAAPRPEAFLTLAVLPAMRAGEERVAVDAEVCPDLLTGLEAAMAWIRRWRPTRRPVRVEAPAGCAHTATSTERVAASLYSGGVDSLALLRWNTGCYPAGHPRRIRRCILYRGVWSAQPDDRDRAGEQAQERLNLLETTAADLAGPVTDVGATLVPVFTNVQNLSDADVPFWHYEYQGAALTAVAHVLADDLHTLSIASTQDVANIFEWGSHPLLDHHYGSHDVRVEHALETWSRTDKLRLLADWDAALTILRVCNRDATKTGNCGRCEKCRRTMLALLACGVLDRTPTFAADDLSPADIERIHIPFRHVEGDYRQIAGMLQARGRDDLAAAIQRRIIAGRAIRARKHFTRRLRAADERLLGGSLTAVRARRRAAA